MDNERQHPFIRNVFRRRMKTTRHGTPNPVDMLVGHTNLLADVSR